MQRTFRRAVNLNGDHFNQCVGQHGRKTMQMRCHNCGMPLEDADIARHFAAQGGKAGKGRATTKAKLAKARKAKMEKKAVKPPR